MCPGHGVERLHYAVYRARKRALVAAPVQELGVFLLNVGRIAQHPAAQIDGGGSSKNGTGKSVFD